MNKQEIYEFFDTAGIWYEVTEHKAVYNMEEASMLEMPYPEADAKNLFVREDKKRGYHLITLRGSGRLDLKAFRHTLTEFCIRGRAHGHSGPHSRCGKPPGAAQRP